MQTFLLGILRVLRLLAFDVPASAVAEAALAVMMVDVGLGILIGEMSVWILRWYLYYWVPFRWDMFDKYNM